MTLIYESEKKIYVAVNYLAVIKQKGHVTAAYSCHVNQYEYTKCGACCQK